MFNLLLLINVFGIVNSIKILFNIIWLFTIELKLVCIISFVWGFENSIPKLILVKTLPKNVLVEVECVALTN